jgi:hypothetical protein
MTTTVTFPMVITELSATMLVKDNVAGDIWHDAFFGTEAPPVTDDVVIGCHAGI